MKALLIGAGMALAAGMTMGFSMQPQLDIGGPRPAGPQQFTAWSAGRSTGPFDPAASTYASYQGNLPDYVIGTDWKRATSYVEAAPEPREEPRREELARYEAPPVTVYTDRPETQPVRVAYPSLAGGEPYAADRPATPEQAQADDDAPVIIG